MASSLITKVVADIKQLEADLTRAEARWRRYEEIARKAASATLTGGSLGSGGGGVSGKTSAVAAQKSDLKQTEENLKASLKRQQTDLEFSLKGRLEAVKTYEKARLKAIDSAFAEEKELRRRDAADARSSGRGDRRQAASAARSTFQEEARGQKGSVGFQRVADREGPDDIRNFKKTQDAKRELEKFELEAQKQADAAGEKAFRKAEQGKQEALRETQKEFKKTERAAAEARRAEATALRGQIRNVVGPGGGAGPPFRPIPTGSRPEDIVALRTHLAEADTVGARLSRTLRRVGEEDLKHAEQSARFFGNALTLAATGAVLGGFAQLVKSGIELNYQWERFRFGLGTALALTSKVVDAQGKTVTGARAFAVFSRDSEQFFKNIRTEANKTILTTQELTEVVTTNFSQALRAGIPEKEIIGLTSKIAQVAKSVGLQGGTPQLVQEVRAILSGDIRRGATVAQILGITSQDVAKAKEAGNLVKLINDRLAGAKPVVDAFSKSSNAAFTTLVSKGQDFLRLSLEDVFHRLTGRVLDFNKELSGENIERFARQTGKVLSDLFKPIEAFIDSGRAEKLGETFAKAFQALGSFANSSTFKAFQDLLNYIVDHHGELLTFFGLIQGARIANAGLTGLAKFGEPGGLLAGTVLGTRLRSGIAGGFRNTAVAAGEGTGGAVAASGTGGLLAGARAAAAGLGGATLATIAAVSVAALAEAGIIAKLVQGIRDLPREETAQAAARRSTGILIRPSAATGAVEERLGVLAATRQAAENLGNVRQAAASARTRGAAVTRDQQFTVFDPQAPNGIVRLSLKEAEERLRIASQTQEKLYRIAKEGGDHRVRIEEEKTFQLLNLEKIEAEQKIAKLEGNVRKEIELELALEVAKRKVDKHEIKDPGQLRRFELAAIQSHNQKLADLDQKAFSDTTKAEAEATHSRVLKRRVDLADEIFDIQKKVQKHEITETQGQKQISFATKSAIDANNKDFRATRAQATDLTLEFTKKTLQAYREQRQAREQLADFERNTARQARELAEGRVQAERQVAVAIRDRGRTQEDVELRRGSLGIRQRRAGLEPAFTAIGEQRSELEAQREREQLLQAEPESATEFRLIQLRKQELALETQKRAIDRAENIQKRREEATGIGREREAISSTGALSGLEENELARLRGRRTAVGGTLGVAETEQLAKLEERQRNARAGGEVLAGADEQLRQSRRGLVKQAEEENDLRRESAKAYREMTERIKETTLSLSEDFVKLGKSAQELAENLPQFKGFISPAIVKSINEMGKITPEQAAARAAAIGPANVKLVIDFAKVTEGTVTDPIVKWLMDNMIVRLEQDNRRGPTGK